MKKNIFMLVILTAFLGMQLQACDCDGLAMSWNKFWGQANGSRILHNLLIKGDNRRLLNAMRHNRGITKVDAADVTDLVFPAIQTGENSTIVAFQNAGVPFAPSCGTYDMRHFGRLGRPPRNGETPLHFGVRTGARSNMVRTLKEGSGYDDQNGIPDDVLIAALARRNVNEEVVALVAQAALPGGRPGNVNAETEDGVSALQIAVRKDLVDSVRRLIQKGAALNTVDLHQLASRASDQRMLRAFLNEDFNVRAGVDENTVLMAALTGGQEANAQICLEKDDVDVTHPNGDGVYPLHLAVRNFPDLVATMLVRGALVNVGAGRHHTVHLAMTHHPEILAQLFGNEEGRACVNVPGHHGDTLAHRADAGAVLDSILGAKADVNIPNTAGQTVLLQATEAGDCVKVERLFGTDVTPAVGVNARYHDQTALEIAAAGDNGDLVSRLVRNGRKPTLTPDQILALYRTLGERDPSLRYTDQGQDRSPFCDVFAAHQDSQPDLNARFADGRTLLTSLGIAHKEGSWFLRRGRNDCSRVVGLLVDHKADPYAKDDNGDTITALARSKKTLATAVDVARQRLAEAEARAAGIGGFGNQSTASAAAASTYQNTEEPGTVEVIGDANSDDEESKKEK